MAETPNQSQKATIYHLYSQVSRTYFSYKRPGGDSSYAFVYIQIHNGNVTFRFSKAVTSENKVDYNCYLPAFRISDMANILEGIMARRRDAFEKNESYASDEIFKIPVSSYTGGNEVVIGSLVIDTEMIDGVPRLRLTYNDDTKKDSVSIVFNDRMPVSEITATSKLNQIDYLDLGAFDFAVTLKTLQEPLAPFVYRVVDSAVSSITKYISSVMSSGRNNNSGFRQYKNYGGSKQSNSDDSVENDYDAF